MVKAIFIKVFSFLILFHPVLSTESKESSIQKDDSTPVIIVGAGAAGLTPGYLLHQQGIQFKILEASTSFDGRMKRNTDFANFPIPLGAEWMHVEPTILQHIVNDESVKIDIKTTKYGDDVETYYEGEEVNLSDFGMQDDRKFINSTWFDFFEQYIVPSISEHIIYNAVVDTIDYTNQKIQVRTPTSSYTASNVVVTVPVSILKSGKITFIPELPKYKRQAIKEVTVWEGGKVFIEFSKQFYPTLMSVEVKPEYSGEKLYFDAAYGQDTTQNILGVFAVGSAANPYADLDDEQLIESLLLEIDELSGGQATPNYIKHIYQNWSEEPFIKGAYVSDAESWQVIQRLGENVEQRLFFAGDAYTDGEDWGSVHAAVKSAKRVVNSMQ